MLVGACQAALAIALLDLSYFFCAWIGLVRPGRADPGEQEVVCSDVTRNPPGQDNPHCDNKEQWIGAGGTGHHKVPVHKATEEGGDAGKGAQDQSNPDQQLAVSNHLGEPGVRLAVEQRLLTQAGLLILPKDELTH